MLVLKNKEILLLIYYMAKKYLPPRLYFIMSYMDDYFLKGWPRREKVLYVYDMEKCFLVGVGQFHSQANSERLIVTTSA